MRSKSLSISTSARYTIADRSTAGSYRSLPNRTRRTNEAELASSEAIMSRYSRGALAFYHQRKDSVLLPCDIRWIDLDESLTNDDLGFLPAQHVAFGKQVFEIGSR